PMSMATCIRTPAMAGKSTTRVRRRRAPALRNHVRPARSVAPHSSHAALAVGRTREAILRGPTGNSRPGVRVKTDSVASARAKPAALAAQGKVGSVTERVVLVIVLLAAEVVVGLIDLALEEAAPGTSGAVGSDGDKKGVYSVECRGKSVEYRVSGVE